MPVSYDISNFIESVELYSGVPVDQGQYTNANIAKFLNDAQMIDIVPLIEDLNDEYFVVSQELTINANQARYPIPSDAIGNAVRQVELYTLNDPTGTRFQKVPRVQLDDVSLGGLVEQYPYTVYYFENNDIVLYPAPQSNPNTVGLRIKYYRRPLQLTERNQGALVTSVSGSVVSLSNLPTSFAIGDRLSIVENRQPFNVVAEPLIVGISGLNVTVDDPTGISNNDGVALQGFSIIPNLPAVEDHKSLEMAAVARFLMALDDEAAMNKAQQLLVQTTEAIRRLHSPRDRGSRKKTIPNRAIWQSRGTNGQAWRY